MTFYEMLEQVVELLQCHGRLSYRALKAQFELDDDRLDLLKEELIDIQQIACEQDGRMLVWAGESHTAPADDAVPLPQAEGLPTTPSPPSASPSGLGAADAERRQLTVMFVDLVGSTSISGRLDPEDLREVVRAYQAACTEVIIQFDGYIAQHLGDGLLVYFAWLQAHEDDAQRAIYAGLGIVDAIFDQGELLRASTSRSTTPTNPFERPRFPVCCEAQCGNAQPGHATQAGIWLRLRSRPITAVNLSG